MANTKDWYARKLGVARPQVQEQQPPAPVGWGAQPQQPFQQQPQYQQPSEPVEEYAPPQAKHLRATTRCPECYTGRPDASGYVMGVRMTTYKWGGKDNHRCPDCGYPLVQSGSGEGHVNPVPGATRQAPGNSGSTWVGIARDGTRGFIGTDPTVKTSLPR